MGGKNYPHHTDEQTKAQQCDSPGLSQPQLMLEVRFEPGLIGVLSSHTYIYVCTPSYMHQNHTCVLLVGIYICL